MLPVHQYDPLLDPDRFADLGGFGRPVSCSDRNRHSRIGAVVFATHPSAVLAVAIGYRIRRFNFAGLDSVNNNCSDSLVPGISDLGPVIVKQSVQLLHSPYDPENVPLRL